MCSTLTIFVNSTVNVADQSMTIHTTRKKSKNVGNTTKSITDERKPKLALSLIHAIKPGLQKQ